MVLLWKLHVNANDNVLIHSKSTCANDLSDLKTKSLLTAKGVDFERLVHSTVCKTERTQRMKYRLPGP